MIKFGIVIGLLLGSFTSPLFAQENDTIGGNNLKPYAVSFSGGYSYVFTPTYVKNKGVLLDPAGSASSNFYFKFSKKSLLDTLFGSPYFGIGYYKPYFVQKTILGDPFSLYLLYSSTLWSFSPGFSLDVEARLGGSFNWNPYNKVSNPDNRMIGAKNNYHTSGSLFLNYKISRYLSSRLGVSFTHNSDGAYKLPNAGLNTLGAFADLMVNFGSKQENNYHPIKSRSYTKSRFEYDLELMYISRQVRGTVEGTGYTGIANYSFDIAELNAFAMFVKSYYFRFGMGVQLMYDESIGTKLYEYKMARPEDITVNYVLADVRDRFAAGLYGRFEAVWGYVSTYFDAGYVHSGKEGFYNSMCFNMGFKSYIYKGFNAKLGVQFVPNRKSNSALFGIGYTINHKSLHRH